MMIRKLTASFGKLKNETLSFHDGLNVIYAPNESGKSTWCAFIQAMLYGIDSSERMRAGYIPDKLRYAPWSGAPMEGSMELSADRCDITITRRTRNKSAPMQDFSAVYTGSNVAVRGLTASNAGEQLTGVTKDVFRRSAFIAQGTMAVSGSPELEKRIGAIVSTGEEQTSFSEADERLRAWQRKRRYNRKGILPELEGKMDEAQRRLDDMGGSLQDVDELEARLDSAKQECRELEKQVSEARKLKRRETLERLNRGREELKECSRLHDEAMDELSVRRESIRTGPFGFTDPDTLEEQVEADMAEYDRLSAAASGKAGFTFAVIFMLLAAAAAALYTHFRMLVYVIAAVVFCGGALFLMLRAGRSRRERDRAREQQKQILKQYHVRSPEEISAALDEHKLLWEAMEQAEKNELRRRKAFESARLVQTDLEEAALAALDFSDGSSEAAVLSRELLAARARVEKLSQQIAAANGRLAAMGDPLVLASSLSCMKEEYDVICEEYDAICTAAEALREADEELQSRFSPELGRIAAGYMAAVTGGRYSDVFIDRDFSAKARAVEDSVPHEAEYLSAGTLDIMYLAVRLAVCELAMPEGEPCPLIIDDALVNLDEERLEQAMKLLREIARERQVILFSCRKGS